MSEDMNIKHGYNLKGLQYKLGPGGKLDMEYDRTLAIYEYWHLQVDWLDKVFNEYMPKVIAGEISPIHLYMQLMDMNEEEVALRTRFSKRTIRRHMRFDGFKKATVKELAKYSDIFGVPVAAFFCFTDPSMINAPLRVETSNGGLVSLVKPDDANKEWNFLRTPTRRTL